MKADPKSIAAVVGAFVLLAGSITGGLYVSTPKAQQCEVDLREAEVRLEFLNKAKDACKVALEQCAKE